MLRHNQAVKAFARLGAMLALIAYLFSGIVPALQYGHSIGVFMNQALADTPFGGAVFEVLLLTFGAFMGGLAGLMIFILLGAMFGTAMGIVIIRVIEDFRETPPDEA